MTFTPIPLVPLANHNAPPLPSAPPLPAAAPVVPLADLILQYRELRDRKADVAARHKEEMDPISAEIAELADLILRRLGEQGQSSSKTSAGTATVVTNYSYSMADAGEFRQWLDEHPEGARLLGNTISKESLEEYLGAGNQLPPGIKPSAVTSLRVNKPTAKKE